MKKTSAFIAFTLLSAVLVSAFTPRVLAYDWRDDFNYQTLNDLKQGWTLQNEQFVLVGGGFVNLTAAGQEGSLMSYIFPGYDSPSGITDFTVEIRHRPLEAPNGEQCSFSIITEMHRFSFACSGESKVAYNFQVGDQSNTPTVQNVSVDWHTLKLEKTRNVLTWYLDGTNEGSYTESDNVRDGLVGVELQSNSSYDYVSVSGPPANTVLQSLYVITILVVIVGISTAVFVFWRGRKQKHSPRHVLPPVVRSERAGKNRFPNL